MTPLLHFLISLPIFLIIPITLCDPMFTKSLCLDKQTMSPNSKFQTNLNTLFSSLYSNATHNKKVYNTTIGNGSNKVYGAFFCRIDQTSDFCQLCISLAIQSSNTSCFGKRNSIIWYDQCMLRYSDEPFYGKMTDSPMILMKNKQNSVNIQNITSNLTSFAQIVVKTLGGVSLQASLGGSDEKFATKEGIFQANLTRLNVIYTLAECTTDLSKGDCYDCLKKTIGNMSEMCDDMKGCCTMMNPSCSARCELNAFYGGSLSSGSASPPPHPLFVDSTTISRSSKKKKTSIILGVTISSTFAILILLGAWIFASKRKSIISFDEVDVIEEVESLRFDLSKIRKATNNFSTDNKLGQGGFGEVYKGTLENGECIAIKRLSSNSKQGISQFKTEVVLVAKLQHRNLVKLLGFCLSKREKILVYEFLPNMSLDRFLLDPKKRASLNWSTRFKIIRGIARGLLYLHEDSRLKIVHRDLKPSNILLDEHMNPKIADFGMAKLFGIDQTQDNTDRIVGTLGYMAPEYLIGGHFSVKSDVYGFGIIVLELVSGQKNKYSRQVEQEDDESLFLQAWRLWNEGMPLKLADPSFKGDFPIEELAKCIHIGLLCIQDDKAKRPQMVSILALLNGESITLPFPTPPSFMACHVNNTYEDGYSHPTCSSISIDVR